MVKSIMKTISEVQQEIRGIQKELYLLNNRLKALDEELVNFKDVDQENSLYQKIYELAAGMLIIKHPLMKENQTVKNNYFAILIMVATLEDSINEDQLLFLQRIIMNDPYNKWLNHYVGQLRKLKPENVIYNCDETVKKYLAEQLLLDLIIIANLSRTKSKRTFELVAQIVAFLGINKERVSHIGVIAVTVLTQNINKYSCSFNNSQLNSQKRLALCELINEDAKRFQYYLKEIPGWNAIVQNAFKFKNTENSKKQGNKVNNNRRFDVEDQKLIDDIQYKRDGGVAFYNLGWYFETQGKILEAISCYTESKKLGHRSASSRLKYLMFNKHKLNCLTGR